MKSTYKILAVALSVLALSACNDLDQEIQGGFATTEQKKEIADSDPSKLLYAVTGIAGNLNTLQAIGGNDIHNDFGYPSLMLWLDSRGTDLVGLNIGYNWFASSGAMTDAASGNTYGCLYAWRYPYNNIYAANNLLATIGETSTDKTTMFYIAQAKGFRAFDYWVLAQLFQFNYKGNESRPCVPIVTEKNSEEIALAGGVKRATVQEVYTQILNDLNSAIELITNSGVNPAKVIDSKPKRLLSKAALLGLRARVYLTMHEYAKAAEDARAAISNFSGKPASIADVQTPSFSSIEESNWMWGVAISEKDRTVTSGIINWPSHMGSLCGNAYAGAGAWRMINTSLYSSIPESDVRKGWFLNADGQSANLPAAWQEYCTNNQTPAFTQVKFGPYQNILDNTTKGQDIPLMRVEEMYLIVAEAEAMTGGGAAALNSFVKEYRDPSYNFTGSAPEAVQEEVWRQRRIELWGEGLSWFDIMRLNKGIDRRNGGWPAEWTYVIPARSSIMIFPIPERETNANKLITPADNNPTSPQPVPVK